jgi:hypothetical protein
VMVWRFFRLRYFCGSSGMGGYPSITTQTSGEPEISHFNAQSIVNARS